MKVLVIGGNGYLGSAVVRRLRSDGHQPLVLVRDPDRPPADPAVEQRVGDLADPASLRSAVTDDVDAVVHAAPPTGDWDADAEAVDTLVAALAGRALVYLSGVWVLGETVAELDETAPVRPIPLVARRPELEARVTAADTVRGVVVRLGIVHGRGAGIPQLMVDWARAAGIGRHVGSPDVRWPMVHVDDVASLVVLALESAEPGTVLHGVAEPGVPVADLAVAADVAAGGAGAAEAWPVADAAEVLGEEFAEALALHQVVGAPAAAELGWQPTGMDAVTDVRAGSYAPVQRLVVQPDGAAQAFAADLEAIVALVREVEDAQQREDAAAFTALFQRDTVWTTAHGHRMIGWDEIDRFTQRVLPGAMRESTATYEVEHVLFVRPDVAVANLRQRPVSLAGEPLDGVPEGRPAYVLVRNDGRWKIAAGQNTQVATG